MMVMAMMSKLKVMVAAVAAAAALATAPMGGGSPTPVPDHTPFSDAVHDFAEQISTRAETVLSQAAEAGLGITPSSSVMETLAQGVSELEAQVGRSLARLDHRARYVASRANRQQPKGPYEPGYIDPQQGRLWGVEL